MRFPLALLLVPLALSALFGCERMRDVKRCRTLAHDVNTVLDAVEHELEFGKGAGVYAKISKHYGVLSRAIEHFEGGSPELEKAVEELAALARTSARQAAAMSTALDAENPGSATLAGHELERLAKQHKALVLRIDAECRPKDR